MDDRISFGPFDGFSDSEGNIFLWRSERGEDAVENSRVDFSKPANIEKRPVRSLAESEVAPGKLAVLEDRKIAPGIDNFDARKRAIGKAIAVHLDGALAEHAVPVIHFGSLTTGSPESSER